ncbi:MAG TPA: DinB family protein [Mariprofundaceae bacterium]|nr:DinB family protein [Mariprofundaceae bacterium]
MLEYLRRMARYNQWVNRKLFAGAAQLPDAAIQQDRGAPYGSILGTLNHIFVADVLWLIRFGSHEACHPLGPVGDIPKPTSLSEVIFSDLEDMTAPRDRLDDLIVDFSKTWTDEMLNVMIGYHTLSEIKQEHPLGELLQNFFNHQTHHRGQATALLRQAGVDVGSLDLEAMLMEERAAA